jgi:hypothetical protein
MYVIGMLPFAALLITGCAHWFWQWQPDNQATSTIERRMARERWRHRVRRGRTFRLFSSVLAVAIVAVVLIVALPRWPQELGRQMRSDAAAPSREAVAWLSAHADPSDYLLIDNTIWVDLVERGFKPGHTVWFPKLDLDPAVQAPWHRFDYVVRSKHMANNCFSLPKCREVDERSRLVTAFGEGEDRIEIRRVIGLSPPAAGRNHDP